MTLSVDTLLENRYRIDRLLAQGGMGAIYQGFDNKLLTNVAIKENFFQTPESVRQFQQEALILARLRHPSLPRVSDHFIHQGQQYLVMDFIEGQDLWQIIKLQRQPLAEAQAINYIKQVGEAVVYLHQQQPPIIHRDIKPQNIKITPQGQAVLVDFGIAKVAEVGERTTTGAQGVTPGFSPPEQYSRMGTTPQSDIYALGATLYALLTGQRPPDSISLLAGGVKFEPPRVLNPRLSEQVSQAIVHAMQPRAEQRPATVMEWLSELTGEVQANFHDGPTMLDHTPEPTNLSPRADTRAPTETVPPMPSEMVPPRRVDTIPPTVAPTPNYRPAVPTAAPTYQPAAPTNSIGSPTVTPPPTTPPKSAWSFWSMSMAALALMCTLSMGVTCFVIATSGNNPDDISGGEVVATQIAVGQTVTAEAIATETEIALNNQATVARESTATAIAQATEQFNNEVTATAAAEATLLAQPTDTPIPTETPTLEATATIEPTATVESTPTATEESIPTVEIFDEVGDLPGAQQNDIPMVDDAENIEATSDNLNYITYKSLDEVSSFYMVQVVDLGWQLDPEQFDIKNKNFKIGFIKGDRYLTVEGTQKKNYVEVIAQYSMR